MPISAINPSVAIGSKKIKAIKDKSSQGLSINRIARECDVDWRTARSVIERESMEIAQRKEALLTDSLKVAEHATAQVLNKLPEGNLVQSATVAGIYLDKVAQLSGDPALIIRHEHAHLHAHEHHFQTFSRENIKQILAQLPAAADSPSAPPMHLHTQPDSAQKESAPSTGTNPSPKP